MRIWLARAFLVVPMCMGTVASHPAAAVLDQNTIDMQSTLRFIPGEELGGPALGVSGGADVQWNTGLIDGFSLGPILGLGIRPEENPGAVAANPCVVSSTDPVICAAGAQANNQVFAPASVTQDPNDCTNFTVVINATSGSWVQGTTEGLFPGTPNYSSLSSVELDAGPTYQQAQKDGVWNAKLIVKGVGNLNATLTGTLYAAGNCLGSGYSQFTFDGQGVSNLVP